MTYSNYYTITAGFTVTALMVQRIKTAGTIVHSKICAEATSPGTWFVDYPGRLGRRPIADRKQTVSGLKQNRWTEKQQQHTPRPGRGTRLVLSHDQESGNFHGKNGNKKQVFIF